MPGIFPFIAVATFTILNLFIAIIVNAMQTYSEQEHREAIAVVEHVRTHIEADLHAEMGTLRVEIRELKTLLGQGETSRTNGAPQP